MFNLNKISGHIKMLEFEELKLSRYAEEAEKMERRNEKREADIQRALRRVRGSLGIYRAKLEAVTQAPARPTERPAIGSDDPLKPYIG